MGELVERRATVDGRTFVWLEAGEGPPVVLLHGFPDGPQAWEPTAAALSAAGNRVLAPYLRGYHPATIVPGRGYDARSLGEDVVAFLDAVEVDRAAVVGHDWGASAAQTATNLASERVRRLVSIAIPHARALAPSLALLLMARHFVYFKLPWADAATRRRGFAYLDRLARRWAPNWSGPDRDALVAAAKQRFADPQVLHAALDYYRAISPRPPRVATSRTDVPTLLVGGTADLGGDPTPFERSERGFVGDFELLLVDGAGHWPHLERPDVVVPAIVDWVGKD